jgi:CBS domain-containing protein
MRTVRDIMKTDLVTVRLGTTVQELVQLLDDEGISGVPVLDSESRIRGVVSRTDVIRFAAREPEIPLEGEFWETVSSPAGDGDDEGYFLGPESPAAVLPGLGLGRITFHDLTVDEIMTPVAFRVDPEMLIWEAAEFLVRGRIHRALVVDDEKLVGIITAFDILRVVAGDADVD